MLLERNFLPRGFSAPDSGGSSSGETETPEDPLAYAQGRVIRLIAKRFNGDSHPMRFNETITDDELWRLAGQIATEGYGYEPEDLIPDDWKEE